MTRKPSQPRAVQFTTEFPPLPPFPNSTPGDPQTRTIRTDEWGQWYRDFLDRLRADQQTVEDAFAKLEGAQAAPFDPSGLEARLAALEQGQAGGNRGLIFNHDVAPDAAIEESKIDLAYPTHSPANDPTAGEKAALAGTAGTPGADNRYVTEHDPRLLSGGAVPDPTPTGTIRMFGGATLPAGYLECLGQPVNRTTYAALFAVLGTTWGSVDGTSFNLPDLRGRSPMGAGTGTGLVERILGVLYGAENVTLTAAESGLPAHSHTIPWRDNTTPSGEGNNTGAATGPPTTTVTTSVSTALPASASHNNIHPVAAVKFMIKT